MRSIPAALPSAPQTFEANVVYALRFMVDTGMGGGSWVELPAGSWKKVPENQVRRAARAACTAAYAAQR